MEIRPWTGDPAPVATALSAAFTDVAFAEHDTASDILAHVAVHRATPERSFVAWDGERPVGALLAASGPDGVARIETLGVAQAHRGTGASAALFTALFAVHPGAVHAEILCDDARAQAIARRHGFTQHRRLFSLRTAHIGRVPLVPVGGRECLRTSPPGRPRCSDAFTLAALADLRVAHEGDQWLAWYGERVYDYEGDLKRLTSALPEGGYHIHGVPEGDRRLSELQTRHWVVFAEQWEVIRAGC